MVTHSKSAKDLQMTSLSMAAFQSNIVCCLHSDAHMQLVGWTIVDLQ